MLSAQSSTLSLRHQTAMPSQAPIAEPSPSPSPAASRSENVQTAARSKNFVLADMDGRNPRDNRACSSCIATLTASEVGQVNWHLTEDEPCRLCQIAAIKPEAYTKPFIDFLEENPTVFHTVDYFERKLSHLGFKKVCGPEIQHVVVFAGH
jgi:aminopeptidase I